MGFLLGWATLSVSVYIFLFLCVKYPKVAYVYEERCPLIIQIPILCVSMVTGMIGTLPFFFLILWAMGYRE
jgi:hypothetical protein